ncbi:MAG: Aminodeoxychorismate lyase [Candidatus Collierbacteria bacterium GW2011_GWC2_44_18]|uniref:Endolytic murein transglycosylase n=1 Tax=Candidatus Collierbacteria bacterium GW2011_GWC2_44_18 TaxID=1618392 RepID=A0A0G1HS49_9BACT|nr:MAG: Aminodeoxychorismate lyase [Microgenomates group bacterium GW2011_GWC1_44_10]KKT49765.1 MAG: Aminodeoxychorismate lyase [Candidatus Collierbacteria bacterium GW2011_GWC2_44_18]
MFKRFFTALTLLTILFLTWYFQSVQPVTHDAGTMVDFEVKPGAGVDRIANDLSSVRLIRSRIGFKITIIRLGVANKIQAGLFRLSPSMSATELAEALTHAYARQIRVTIPEGLRSEEINSILDKAFNKLEGSNYNPLQFTSLTRGKEGHLFPDTYDFVPEASASDVVRRLTGRFDEVVSNLKISEQNLPKVLILASLLEREAANSTEMPLVAGVITKRLNIGMALQIDATVQYALGSIRCKQINCDWWKKSLTTEDLKINSPFNTYQNPGLPPSPISNPGKDALSAATNPVVGSALYYLHDSTGKIHFADSLPQHNQNICTYLKKDCK